MVRSYIYPQTKLNLSVKMSIWTMTNLPRKASSRIKVCQTTVPILYQWSMFNSIEWIPYSWSIEWIPYSYSIEWIPYSYSIEWIPYTYVRSEKEYGLLNKKTLMAEAVKNGLPIPQITFFLDVMQLESNLLHEIRSACSWVKLTISGRGGNILHEIGSAWTY